MRINSALSRGAWHGPKYYFGFHNDVHVMESDRDIGARCDAEELAAMLRLTGADFVQTDSKGHPGYTSWFSQTPAASVGPGMVKDALLGWREATHRLGLPLHAHYSGIWDKAAGAKHPEWCILSADGRPVNAPFTGAPGITGDKMCPRSSYVDELMIPQLFELIDRYGIDGFWIDGDLWAMEPCYCPRCRQAFTAQTGIAEPPTDPGDPHWPAWWNFTRESFEAYVTHYVEAVHQHKPGILVCSNWLQTFKNPGEPKVPTDWISGDNTPVWGVDSSRCEARFISTRGKPWDIMMWCFYFSHGWFGDPTWQPVMKPVQMLEQEAAVIVAFGGNVQVCENPFSGVRSGQLNPWRVKRIGALARFVERRRSLCQGSQTIPQVAVLHSEEHIHATPNGPNLQNSTDVAPVQGSVFSLLECHYGVDILDEWALQPCLADFPVVVAPEQDEMSDRMVQALKGYVEDGGDLLVSGAQALQRFGEDFLGVKAAQQARNAIFHVPALDGAVPVFSAAWQFMTPTTAKSLAPLGLTALRDEQLLPYPAATLNRQGKGRVAYIPFNIFRDFEHNRYPMTREFLRDVMRALAGKLEIEVEAPACIDVVLRQKSNQQIIHLINRSSGVPNLPNSGVIDEIPPVGPITITLRQVTQPEKVHLAFEEAVLATEYLPGTRGGTLKIIVPSVQIHAAVVIAGSAVERGNH